MSLILKSPISWPELDIELALANPVSQHRLFGGKGLGKVLPKGEV